MGNMIFNGVSTDDLGVVIQTIPSYSYPSRDVDVHRLEGRNGDLIIDKRTFRNVNRTYYLASVYRGGTNFVDNANAIVNWLHSVKGYARLEDSYEPDYYRLAAYQSSGELKDIYGEATTLEVVFNCKPQRYLKTGDEPVILTKGTFVEVFNPTSHEAFPLIEIQGNNLTFEFYSGGQTGSDKTSEFTINFTNGIVDSELQDVYNSSEYLNDKITMTNGFPKLKPGVNYIKITGTTLTNVTIKPRWWTL